MFGFRVEGLGVLLGGFSPFWGGVGSLIKPFKQKRAPFLILGYWAT